ncbi:MAG: hypothetical protein AAF357_04395 [Verrucomicrobiota bacterium]
MPQSATQLVENATGLEKFSVLANLVDHIAHLTLASRSIDEQVATLDIETLALEHGVTFETLRQQIRSTMGSGVVFRLGKRWLIRKTKFLEFLQTLENR